MAWWNMAERPLVSIGMPVFNCESTLSDAIASILQQDFTDWELLIIDDGSRDGTLELARSFADPRIRVFADGLNRGLAARLNEAVKLARGEYFARMDGDDIAFADRLSTQLDFLRIHPDTDLVGGGALIFTSDLHVRGLRLPPMSHEEICATPWIGFPILHPTFMARRTWFARFPYDETMVKSQDQVLLANACLSSRFANVQRVMIAYREDEPSLGKLWASRRCSLRGWFKTYMALGKTGWAWHSVLSLGLRMIFDVLATILPLRGWQLRRRSVVAGAEDIQRWHALLASIRGNGAAMRKPG